MRIVLLELSINSKHVHLYFTFLQDCLKEWDLYDLTSVVKLRELYKSWMAPYQRALQNPSLWSLPILLARTKMPCLLWHSHPTCPLQGVSLDQFTIRHLEDSGIVFYLEKWKTSEISKSTSVGAVTLHRIDSKVFNVRASVLLYTYTFYFQFKQIRDPYSFTYVSKKKDTMQRQM